MGDLAYETREADRRSALAARRTALRIIPVVAAVWVVLAVVSADSELVLRIGTLVAVAASVVLGARAAVTSRAFVRRWLDEDARRPPPMWVTLVALAGAVATLVAGANVAADISSNRPAVRSLVLGTVFLAATVAAALAHVTGGRGVAAALAAPTERAPDDGRAAPPTAAVAYRPDRAATAPAAQPTATAFDRTGSAPGDGGGTGAPPDSQLRTLRMFLRDFVTANAGPPADAARAGVAVFRRVQPADIVAEAHAELRVVRSRHLDEQTLAQVIMLLGCQYYPSEHGGTYREWMAELESAFAADDPS